MKELIYIFLGGGTGSVLRYYVQELLHERIIPYSFPVSYTHLTLPTNSLV